MKETYESPVMEIVTIGTDDVIFASSLCGGDCPEEST